MNCRHQRNQSFRSILIPMRKCLAIRSNKSSFDAAPHASLRKYRSGRLSSLPCSIELLVVSQRTSWIRRGLSLTTSIVNAVEGLEPGAYVYHRDGHVLECLKTGNFRAQAGHLGLDQQLPAEAAADIFFLADLKMILERFGNRGY